VANTGGTKCGGVVIINHKSKKNWIENYSKPVEMDSAQWVQLQSQNIVLSDSFYEKVIIQKKKLEKKKFLGATIDFFAKQCPANPHNIEELEQKMEKYIQNKDEEEFPHEAMTELWEDYVNCIDMVQGKGSIKKIFKKN